VFEFRSNELAEELLCLVELCEVYCAKSSAKFPAISAIFFVSMLVVEVVSSTIELGPSQIYKSIIFSLLQPA
jgi:hypothetical protein